MGIFGKKTEDNKGEDVVKEAKKPVKTEASPKKEAKKEKKASKKDIITSTVSAYGTIIAPIVTEKSHEAVAKNKYTFRIEKKTTKKQVKDVIEEMYGVSVENVNVIVVKPKRRTVKYDRGYQKLYKKAIVTVREGDHIAVFEGV